MTFKCGFAKCMKHGRRWTTQRALDIHMWGHACQWEIVDKVTGESAPCGYIPLNEEDLHLHVAKHVENGDFITQIQGKKTLYFCPWGHCQSDRHQGSTRSLMLTHVMSHAPCPKPQHVEAQHTVARAEVKHVIPCLETQQNVPLEFPPKALSPDFLMLFGPVAPTPSSSGKKRPLEEPSEESKEVKKPRQSQVQRLPTPPGLEETKCFPVLTVPQAGVTHLPPQLMPITQFPQMMQLPNHKAPPSIQVKAVKDAESLLSTITSPVSTSSSQALSSPTTNSDYNLSNIGALFGLDALNDFKNDALFDLFN